MELGLRGDDWFITPRELEALIKRHNSVQRNGLLGAAMVCSLLANINRDESKRKEPFTVADFMPGEKTEPTIQQKLAVQRDQWRRTTAHIRSLGVKGRNG